jgi:hypothetical protein
MGSIYMTYLFGLKSKFEVSYTGHTAKQFFEFFEALN